MSAHPGPDETHVRVHHRVLGWIDGEPVGRQVLDDRLDRLRRGPRRSLLPPPGTAEHRQAVRWLARVILTEELCAAQVARRGSQPAPLRELDAPSAALLGSITAAAWRSHPAVGTLFALTTPSRPVGEGALVRQFHVRHAVGATAAEAVAAPLSSLGWTTGSDLPAELSAALRAGTRDPVRTGGGWQVLRVDGVRDVPARPPDGDRATDLRDFARLLEALAARSVRPAAGFEHPGDPRQPDHVHRH